MWISVFAVTLAVAVGSCIAAILMRPKRMRAHWKDTLMRQAPPAPASQAPHPLAHEYAEGEDCPRPVSPSVAEHLGQHYRPILSEQIPARLMELIRRL